MSERDGLFEQARRLVVANNQGSIPLLTRYLKIGYARAGRLLDQLEEAGIVGPSKGASPRDVLRVKEIE